MEKGFIVTYEQASFLNDALNFYWNDAVNNLQRKDLGDIERSNYEKQKSKSKYLMDMLEAG